jgi:hypothetical protein
MSMIVHTLPAAGAPPAGVPRPAPVDLDRVPAVDAFLILLGLGRLDRDTVTASVGRDQVWAGRTQGGRWVSVKRLIGGPDHARVRIRRTLAFEKLATRYPDLPRGPALLGSDEAAQLLVFEYLADARTGADLAAAQEFGDPLAYAVGQAVGRLHITGPAGCEHLHRSTPLLPSPALLRGLPLAMFGDAGHAAPGAWSPPRRDHVLVAAVDDLTSRERAAPPVPAHCDLRVDRILVTGDRILITDWEECRLADPARDVGSFAGEWLYRSALARSRSRITAFWRGYRSIRVQVDDGLAARATAFAGWHLLERMVAGAAQRPGSPGAAQRPGSPGIERAAASIGRTALCAPDRFVTALGLGDPHDHRGPDCPRDIAVRGPLTRLIDLRG